MYRQHFGLREKPFRVVPSPRFLFASETHDENRARVLYGIREDRGFVVVSGGIGLGKTTVLLSVLDSLGPEMRTALIFNPVDDFRQLLRMICYEFEIDPSDQDEVEMMRSLNLFLVETLAAGRKCVLIIDEAQNLPVSVLEKIRTLNNLQTEELSLLQIVLVGQPELREKLDDPRLVQLRQRIGVWHELCPLTQAETRSYIWHRLRLAGAPMAEAIIDDDACHRVHQISGGIPRLINQIADTAMVVAYGDNNTAVGVSYVDEAGRELQLLSDSEAEDEEAVRAPWRVGLRMHRPRARTVVAAGIGGLLLSGAVTYGSWLPRLTDLLAQPVQEQATEAASASAAQVAEAAIASSPDSVDEGLLRRMGERRAVVEQLRAQGRPMFAVHLGSFRSAPEARDYVLQLIRRESAWEQPFFLELTSDSPGWYRILAGGFPQRDEAQRWMRSIRRSGAVAFAKLDRLPRDASSVSLGVPGSSPQEDRDEQHS
jgi:type II secretory pathway predicted ATPase ExeA